METIVIQKFELHDLRFPTGKDAHGSDAMHTDPNYSMAYVIIHTNNPSLTGYGFTFTLGRGTEVVIKCIEALQSMVLRKTLHEITSNFAGIWDQLVNEPQLRWLGPEKGVIHLAVAAIVNGLWDLWARFEKKPFWKLVVDMEPEQLLSALTFRYVEDYLTKEEALIILRRQSGNKSKNEAEIRRTGYPLYVTSVGWLGYNQDKIRTLCKEALADGFTRFKMKVGSDLEDDKRRMKTVRDVIGYDTVILMVDANQKWSVQESINWMKHLAPYKPLWIEEPTNADDIMGHAKIRKEMCQLGIKVATGEHCQNRVMFKQFLEQQGMDICQIDSCRLGGANEIIVVMLMAAKAGVPVVPHAGGVGLCELVHHYSFIDYICISGSVDGRMCEFADHLHEHFKDPVRVNNGAYMLPTAVGFNSEVLQSTIDKYEYPTGTEWRQ